MAIQSEFADTGYSSVVKALDTDCLASAADACADALSGPLPRHLGNKIMTRGDFASLPSPERTRYGLMNAHQWTDVDLLPFIEALKTILMSDKIFERLNSIDDEEHYTLHQTIFFFKSPCTTPHIEAMTMDTYPQSRAHTVWIAIDDVTPLNGPPYVVATPRGVYDPYPGDGSKESHRAMVLANICSHGSPITALDSLGRKLCRLGAVYAAWLDGPSSRKRAPAINSGDLSADAHYDLGRVPQSPSAARSGDRGSDNQPAVFLLESVTLTAAPPPRPRRCLTCEGIAPRSSRCDAGCSPWW